MQTRRDVLKGGAALVAATAVPAEAMPALPAVDPAAAVPLDVGWMVGQEDRHNWERIYAPSKDDAIREWATMHHGGECCEYCGRSFVTGEMPGDADESALDRAIDDDCDECTGFPIRADRVKLIDPYEGQNVPDRVKWRLGWWVPDCSRCDWQPDPDCNGEASDYGWLMGEHFVCEDCVTLADLEAHYPDEYADRLDELLTDEYGEALNV